MNPKKNAAPCIAENSAQTSASYTIQNIRERRLLTVLLRRGETSRHDLDRLIGAENSPDVVFRLRNKGLTIPCERRQFSDRDGEKVRIGIYSLTASDRQKAVAALKCLG